MFFIMSNIITFSWI